jgi:hypothetical protein
MLSDIAGWVAPIATMTAATMTALNLGARLTGWGFVVFTVGSVCWVCVGVATGQTNLIASNGFLTLINCVGCWRWLGRQRAIEDGGKSATAASRRCAAPTLFTATGLAGMPVVADDRQTIGKAVEGLIECGSGKISYVVVATAGGSEQLRAVPRDAITIQSDHIMLGIPPADFAAIAPLEPGNWPPRA